MAPPTAGRPAGHGLQSTGGYGSKRLSELHLQTRSGPTTDRTSAPGPQRFRPDAIAAVPRRRRMISNRMTRKRRGDAHGF